MWCQKLGDTCAVVLVNEGIVVRDALIASVDLARELELSMNRVKAEADGSRRLFVHRNVPGSAELAAAHGGRVLTVTVKPVDRTAETGRRERGPAVAGASTTTRK